MAGNESLTDTPGLPTITWTNIVLGVILFSLVVVTVVGNTLVLIAVYIEKRLQTSFNYYIVNLAITDVAVAVTAMSFYSTYNILGYWPFGEFMCGVWIFFDYGMTFVSVFTLLLISADRFWSVTWFVHYRRHHTKRTSIFSIAFVWFFMLVLWLPPCISDRLQHSVEGDCKWEPSLNKEFVIIVASIGHHGSCVVMLFCYIRVFLVMRQQKRAIGDSSNATSDVNPSSAACNTQTAVSTCGDSTLFVPVADDFSAGGHSGGHPSEAASSDKTLKVPGQKKQTNHIRHKTNRQKRERKVFVTLTYILVAYVVCWVPFHFVFDISSIDASLVPETVYSITFWLTYINSTVNPFLYNFSCADFRATFLRIVCRKGSCR